MGIADLLPLDNTNVHRCPLSVHRRDRGGCRVFIWDTDLHRFTQIFFRQDYRIYLIVFSRLISTKS